MKTKNQLSYSAEFKTKVVFELLLSGVSLQELSDKYNVNIQSINDWKKQMIESASVIFSTRKSSEREAKEIKTLQKKRDMLKKSIDSLQRQNANVHCEHYSLAKEVSQHLILPTNRHSPIKNIYMPLIS